MRIVAGQDRNCVDLRIIEEFPFIGSSVSKTEFPSCVFGMHAEHTGRKFGFRYAASNERELFDDPEINTIAILTRHDSHANLAVAALESGKHVFVEKPL